MVIDGVFSNWEFIAHCILMHLHSERWYLNVNMYTRCCHVHFEMLDPCFPSLAKWFFLYVLHKHEIVWNTSQLSFLIILYDMLLWFVLSYYHYSNQFVSITVMCPCFFVFLSPSFLYKCVIHSKYFLILMTSKFFDEWLIYSCFRFGWI